MKSIHKILIVAAAMTAASCEKTIDVKIPAGVYTTTTIFATDDSALAALRGIYQSMTTGGFSGKTNPLAGVLSTMGGLAADELWRATYNDAQQRFFDNNLTPDLSTSAGIWASTYNYIYQCNMLLESAAKSTSLSAAVKSEIMGEAAFLRGMSFFYLTNLYGDVPMPLTSDYTTNTQLPATPQADIYKQILADLTYAKENTSDKDMVLGGRYQANKWTAAAFLARTHLYQKNWIKAEEEASAVIGQDGYRLVPLEEVFLEKSAEAIWQLANTGANLYTSEASLITGSVTNTTNAAFRLTPYVIGLFEEGDERLDKWTRAGTGTGADTYAPMKFKVFSNTQIGAIKEASAAIRLAEVYLIRAEARAMQDNLSGAIADLDALRIRAGAVADDSQEFQTIAFSNPTIGKAELIKLIYDERLRELFSENGHRWMDAKRAEGSLASFFGDRKPGISETDAYFPIPQNEIEYNRNLTQNDGY